MARRSSRPWLRVLPILLVGACGGGSEAEPLDAPASEVVAEVGDIAPVEGRNGVPGWNILGPDFTAPSALDGMTFEWDYFSVHDKDGAFTGIVGYLIANPRQVDDVFGKMVPAGGNVAIAGQWADGTRTAEYKNFGYEGFSAGADLRSFAAEDAAKGQYGRMTPDPAANTLRLEGRTANFAWDLTISDDWPELTVDDDVYSVLSANDIGKLKPDQEQWNVDVLWPATRVVGSITNQETGVTVDVDGVGYRENSFGRWGFNLGGWDFFYLYDPITPVALVLQTYHDETDSLDFVDVAFHDGDRLVTRRLMATDGGVAWHHEGWRFDTAARQCVPTDTHLAAEDADYRLEAVAAIGEDEAPLLSDATEATKKYVIFEFFPRVSGTITRKADGAVLATFEGQGGGEISLARSDRENQTVEECLAFGATFTYP